ncbi:DUF488 family protein [Dietzia psychralcaliphila]|uniref:DUF488 domain-containing protein n=1 Tax=Dietzia psychralcaliphila TaxID=139021 RepID=A0AAD0JUL3_9ACTN|nr:DUF488 domain-containing protein [Dietzia psychralcaliphila]AWH95828.1 hypothetical protein A6048_10265 [Dietzia psychralcaliphila]PTM85637.1 uncharacterized protein DUF488 [Dietzia psychralcaliphila]
MLLTVGHGRLERDELGGLLTGAGVELLVDIRRFPGSRANSAAAKGAVPDLTREVGIDYRWEEDLGGRRTLSAEQRRGSPDTWWRVEAFRAYSAWTRTPGFRAALDRVVEDAHVRRTAVMCSESVWWRCHRRIVADVTATVHGLAVGHLMHTGKITGHSPSDGLRLDTTGQPVWDSGVT